jgi:DNA anti-recombination protein RmuC
VAKVDLEFLARQIERVINDVAGLKDDMMVVLARFDRIDATTHSLVTEVRAMHSRHDRLGRRLDRVEEREHQGS